MPLFPLFPLFLVSVCSLLCIVGDLCAPNPCANGGTCLSDGNSIRCSCKDGFQGDLCQICDACSPNPCLNNGVCQSNGLGSFACKCPPGTTGRTCDYGKHLSCLVLLGCLTSSSPLAVYSSNCPLFDSCASHRAAHEPVLPEPVSERRPMRSSRQRFQLHLRSSVHRPKL